MELGPRQKDRSFQPLIQNLPFTIIFPVVLSVVLFSMTIFLLIIPSLESALMANRRNLIHNLTEVAWSTLQQYYSREESGELTREQAQEMAKEHIRNLRYGTELKDYFWINDMYPRIIMHPYRTDLENKDVSRFADPTGKRLFVEFVKVVNQQGDGYVDYQWQWKDDRSRIVPKISFVKGFKPWNWVVGTGIYAHDIWREISKITKNITAICIGILLVLFCLSFFIIIQGIQFEKEKQRAESEARLQNEQLIQAAKMATIGTLVSGVAHEINNPATSILLNAPLLKKIWRAFSPIVQKHYLSDENFEISGMDFTSINDRVPYLLDHIEDGAQRIKEIVFELKDFARSNPSEMNDEVNINESVKKAIILVSNMIQKTTDHFAIHYRTDLPSIKGNAKKIEQVMINLLINACQALKDSNGKIDVSTRMNERKREIIVEIKDTGVGIPFELLDRIKDPFFTTKQDSGNTGLGLAISERIVEDHGGKLSFTSFPGKGTSARLSFPIHKV